MASFRSKYPKINLFLWCTFIGIPLGIGILYGLEALHPGLLETISHDWFVFFTRSAQDGMNHAYVIGSLFGFVGGNILGFMGYGFFRCIYGSGDTEKIQLSGARTYTFTDEPHKRQSTTPPLTRENVARLGGYGLTGADISDPIPRTPSVSNS